MSEIQKCRSCGAEVLWVVTKKNKLMPVDASSTTGEEQHRRKQPRAVAYDPKRHISHFATCPQSKSWKKK